MSELLTPQEIDETFRVAYGVDKTEQDQLSELILALLQAQLAKCEASFPARIAEERAKLAYQIDHKICSDCDHFDNGCAFMSSDCLWWQSIKELKI